MSMINGFLAQFQNESRKVGIPMELIGSRPTRINNNDERGLGDFMQKAKREGARIVLALLGDERFYGPGMLWCCGMAWHPSVTLKSYSACRVYNSFIHSFIQYFSESELRSDQPAIAVRATEDYSKASEQLRDEPVDQDQYEDGWREPHADLAYSGEGAARRRGFVPGPAAIHQLALRCPHDGHGQWMYRTVE